MGCDGIYLSYWCHHHSKDYVVAHTHTGWVEGYKIVDHESDLEI